MPVAPENRCMARGCRRRARQMGNCYSHLGPLVQMVNKGVVSWEALIRDGYARPNDTAPAMREQMGSDIKRQKYINDPRRARGV